MAPPSSSTVTNAPVRRKGDENPTIRLNGQPATELDDDELLQHDPKYKDFFWTYTEEPHRTRRLAIIKAHPEVSTT